jgi:hypothetical protein
MTPQERNARLAEFTPAEWREYLLDAWTAPSDPEVCPDTIRWLPQFRCAARDLGA